MTNLNCPRRVDFAVIEPLSERDRRVIVLPATQAARARLTPMITIALPQLATFRPMVPSYVADAVDALIAAFSRWESDERTLNNAAR